MPTKLTQVAAHMRQALELAQVARKPRAFILRTLPNGLGVCYSYDGDAWRLALRREAVYPADVEIAVIRRDFNIPESAGEYSYTRTDEHPATRRRIKYCVVELTWREQIPQGNPLGRAAGTIDLIDGPDAAVWAA